MKKQLLSIGLLLGMTNSIFAVKMPSAEVLNKRLEKEGFSYFTEKTNIVKQLADEELETVGVACTIDLSLDLYVKYLNDSRTKRTMELFRPRIFEIILQDHPEALEELKSMGLL